MIKIDKIIKPKKRHAVKLLLFIGIIYMTALFSVAIMMVID